MSNRKIRIAAGLAALAAPAMLAAGQFENRFSGECRACDGQTDDVRESHSSLR